jgi:hypothetical protein
MVRRTSVKREEKRNEWSEKEKEKGINFSRSNQSEGMWRICRNPTLLA